MRGGIQPPEQDFFKSARASYSNKPQLTIDGFTLVVSTPTLKVYQKDKTLLVAVRGTKLTDKNDLVADARLPLNLLNHSTRYKRDKETFDKVIKHFPPQDYEYYLSGHSLGGAVDNQLKYDYPFIKNAVEYNPAFQPKDFLYSQGPDIKRLYTDKDALYNLGGKLFTNKHVIPATNSIGNSYIDSISGHILSNFASLYNNSSGGAKPRESHPLGKIWGSYKDGSVIFKDKKGYYILRWLKTKNIEVKRHLKGLKKWLDSYFIKRGEGDGSKNAGFIKMLYAKRVLKRKPEDYKTRDKKAPNEFLIDKISKPSTHLQKKFEVAKPLNRPFKKGERDNLSANQLTELRRLERERKHKSLAKKEGVSLEEYYQKHPKVKR